MNHQKRVQELILRQNDFFAKHKTKDYHFRKKQLITLRKAVQAFEPRIYEALWADLHKSEFETFATEISLIYDEIDHHLSHLKEWMGMKKYATNQLLHFWSRSYVQKQPFGRSLIIAPWNYPFQLLILPLVGAISAGNTAVLKPSEYTPKVSAVIAEMIREFFDEDFITVIEGDKEIAQAILKEQWDIIFFTGSPVVGKIIMKAAAEYLTPVILELGGKSPVIVDEDAHLKYAAKRLAWGKFLNAGQTCIAPDYLFVHEKVHDRFLELLKLEIKGLYGDNPKQSPDYVRIVSEANIHRLRRFLEGAEVFLGGENDAAECYFAPTILINIRPDDAVMQEEIFGPILPVMKFNDLNQVLHFVNKGQKPLALYYFSKSRKRQKKVLHETTSGGACINEVIMHVANSNIPFGGVGNSGMGNYHGKYSFDAFSHQRAVVFKSNIYDPPVRYAPYSSWKMKLIKLIMK